MRVQPLTLLLSSKCCGKIILSSCYQTEVDEALSSVLSRACALEGQLRTASQAYTRLGEVKGDAQIAADMVDKTAVLARDVSAKVRQLDVARVS